MIQETSIGCDNRRTQINENSVAIQCTRADPVSASPVASSTFGNLEPSFDGTTFQSTWPPFLELKRRLVESCAKNVDIYDMQSYNYDIVSFVGLRRRL